MLKIIMKRTFKYRLYPNNKQYEVLYNQFNFCCFLYNCALEERISFYKATGKSRSYFDQANTLPDIKEIFSEETSTIYSQVLQQTLKQVDSAYNNFFGRVKQKVKKVGFPRFKSKDRFKSICFPQVKPDLSGGGIKLVNNKLKVYGIEGTIRIKYHRPIEGIAKQCRIVKQNDRFYFCVTCDNVSKKPLKKTGQVVGIDLGINAFVALDNEETFSHPKPYKTAKDKLAYQQRKLALKQKGSSNRKKQKKLLAKTHQRIVNIREDFQHKLANKLIKENDKIILEKLNIKNMLETKTFQVKKSNISDASWYSFIQKLIYKAESADRSIILVNPANTSKMCSRCGKINKNLSLKDRVFHCDKCGLVIDRDINSAKNIKRLGMSPAITKIRLKALTKVISETSAFRQR
jgi:putative transposase